MVWERLACANDAGGSECRRGGSQELAQREISYRVGWEMLLLAQRGNGNRGGTSSGFPASTTFKFYN